MSDQYVLVKSCFDYADEFDVYGFYVATKEQFDTIMDNARKYFSENGSYEGGFGTNEEVYLTSFDDYEFGLEVTDISENEYQVLSKLFNRYHGEDTDKIGNDFAFGHIFLPGTDY